MAKGERRHDKVVRDRIPEMIAANGQIAETRTVSGEELQEALEVKLGEEFAEYIDTLDMGELADMLEVMRAIVAVRGATWDEIEAIREAKRAERGGFDEGVFLVRTRPGGDVSRP